MLDTLTPLPLFNSLTHLVYLTSTSPRIREIKDWRGWPGCRPTAAREPSKDIWSDSAQRTTSQANLNLAAYRFLLAFQCAVNIGVRGSEQIGTHVAGRNTGYCGVCPWGGWSANSRSKLQRANGTGTAGGGFTIAASMAASAADAQRGLQLQEDPMDTTTSTEASAPESNSNTDMSADNPRATTSLGSGTPTGSVVIPKQRSLWHGACSPCDRSMRLITCTL